ncbi:MAG: nitroreductase family protein [Candidatus Ratteibacteria bacterium]|nr:nitroreductase family protein [Candidatus Ratteibacteria bacterium]
MNTVAFQSICSVMALMFIFSAVTYGQELKPIKLPEPQMTGGKPLMQALKDRHSSREFDTKKLPLQILSNLLWAGSGVNRPSGQRTAPSAVNWQDIDIYVAMEEGLYIYDAKANALNPILAEDIRGMTGMQPFPKIVPVDLIYVSDQSRMTRADQPQKDLYSAADTGFISQNVYLFCASEGLSTVVIAMVDKPALAKKIGLKNEQKIMLVQPVGYPKK